MISYGHDLWVIGNGKNSATYSEIQGKLQAELPHGEEPLGIVFGTWSGHPLDASLGGVSVMSIGKKSCVMWESSFFSDGLGALWDFPPEELMVAAVERSV